MKFYLILLVASQCCKSLAAVCQTKSRVQDQFSEFLGKYSLTFPDPVEYAKRLQIFADNLNFINNMNNDSRFSFKSAVNHIAALVCKILQIS
jgi:hypothetical protein